VAYGLRLSAGITATRGGSFVRSDPPEGVLVVLVNHLRCYTGSEFPVLGGCPLAVLCNLSSRAFCAVRACALSVSS